MIVRNLGRVLRRTPLHPQWLLGGQSAIADWVARDAHGRVLDVGCADRWIASRLSGECDYIGLDYPVTGQDMYGAKPDIFADAGRLPLADDSMDTVIMLEVLEHLRNPREAMAEANRVLRSGGRLLLSVPFLYPIHDAPHDYQRLTRHGVVRDADTAGFHVEVVSGRLGSLETAGLVACLSIGGMCLEALKRRSPSMALVPFLLLLLPAINLSAWLGERLLPSWGAMTNGYLLTARKP